MRYIIRASNSLLLFIACGVLYFTKSETTEKAKQTVEEMCQFLIETDKTLCDKYKARAKDGEKMLDMVREYNNVFASLVKMGYVDKKQNNTAVVEKSQALIDHGGPEFINFYVDAHTLKDTFGLNNMSSRILAGQRQNAVDLWQDFYKLYSKIKDEKDSDSDYDTV